MSDIEVFTKPTCGWCERNFALLEIKRQPYRIVPSCDRFGHKTPEFLSLSPYARVPTIRIDSFVVYESALINDFLDDYFDAPRLQPRDPKARTFDRLWTYHCDSMLIPPLNHLMPKASEDERQTALAALSANVEKLLGWSGLATRDTPFWHGDDIGLVDLVYHTFFEALDHVNQSWPTPLLSLDPQLQVWAERIARHEVVEKAHAIKQTVTYAPDIEA